MTYSISYYLFGEGALRTHTHHGLPHVTSHIINIQPTFHNWNTSLTGSLAQVRTVNFWELLGVKNQNQMSNCTVLTSRKVTSKGRKKRKKKKKKGYAHFPFLTFTYVYSYAGDLEILFHGRDVPDAGDSRPGILDLAREREKQCPDGRLSLIAGELAALLKSSFQSVKNRARRRKR